MHDPIESAHHRKEAKEIRPLWTHEPLDPARQKKPQTQPQRRRKRNQPDTPLFNFHPALSQVPTGKQDPPASPSTPAEPSVSASAYDGQQMTPLADHDSSYDDCDAQKRPRVFSDGPPIEHATSFYPDTSCTDATERGSVPPAGLSDQPPCAAEYAIYGRYQPPAFSYNGPGYGQPALFTQDAYSYSAMDHYADRSAQGYPAQHFDAPHGRAAPHGVPAYPDGNAYPYPPRKY